MRDIFQRHGTDARIVINPLYDQIALNPKDLAVLREIFGESKVFDFSGANAITEEMRNYYDPGHYRPPIANWVMEQVYRERPAQARAAGR